MYNEYTHTLWTEWHPLWLCVCIRFLLFFFHSWNNFLLPVLFYVWEKSFCLFIYLFIWFMYVGFYLVFFFFNGCLSALRERIFLRFCFCLFYEILLLWVVIKNFTGFNGREINLLRVEFLLVIQLPFAFLMWNICVSICNWCKWSNLPGQLYVLLK